MQQYFKSGATVLFQGDSVTDCGQRDDPARLGSGYPAKIASIYDTLFADHGVNFQNRAVSGDRVRNLLSRYDEDIKAVKPDFISILIGVNDTWRRFDSNDPCSAERFEEEYTTLIKKINADFPAAQIMLITPFLLKNDPAKACYREDLDEKIAIVRRLADTYGCILLDYAAIVKDITESGLHTDAELAMPDGIHPTALGQSQLAECYLKKLNII